LRKACGEAVEELRAARKLLASQNVQIEKQAELLALEKEISLGLKNLRTMDAGEKAALRDALSAKDRQIASLEAAIAELKKQRFTFWRKLKVAALGTAVGIIVGAVLLKK
jgi:multidrug efflux pump subunit AcrA (membrane-fusion protein)